MSDPELIAWLASGGKTELPPEVEASRRHSEFARRFIDSLNPLGDLGITCEEHELGVARNVYEVHVELNALGEVEYDNVWRLLKASTRAAIKQYIAMARRFCEARSDYPTRALW